MTPLKPATHTAITPDRLTVVTLDCDDAFLVERQLFAERSSAEMADQAVNQNVTSTATGTSSTPGYNVTFTPRLGWTLKSNIETSSGYEMADWSGTEIAGSVASGILSRPMQRASTDLTGITLGANQSSSGYNFYQKTVAAGGTFNVGLSSDESAYPAPAALYSTVPLRRIFVSTDNADPRDRVSFNILIPNQAVGQNLTEIARYYFSSIAGRDQSDGSGFGTGQYVLRLMANGEALLFERINTGGTFTWKKRVGFKWLAPNQSAVTNNTIMIWSDAVLIGSNYAGTQIYFQTNSGHANGSMAAYDVFRSHAISVLSGQREINFTYQVPDPSANQPSLTKYRIDDRIDTRTSWRIEKALYYRNGSIRCKNIDLGQVCSSSEPLYVQWFGNRPSGTTINVRCFDAETGNELTATATSGSFTDYGWKAFDPASGRVADTSTRKYRRSLYYAVIELTSSDGTKTASITAVRFTRKQISQISSGEKVNKGIIEAISVTGGDSDPTHETAHIRISDLKDEIGVLAKRAQMPVRIDVKYDPTDASKKSTLFTGYVAQAKKQTMGGVNGATSYPADNWSRYDLTCTGEWQRLMEAKANQRFDFHQDGDVEATFSTPSPPFKVTDVIKRLLKAAGYADDNIIIPDYSIRLFVSGKTDNLLTIEPLSELFPIIQQLALAYLGGWIYWDANASQSATPAKMGAWRLGIPGKPNESGVWKTLAHFKQRPDTTGFKNPYNINSQNVETGLSSQPIKTVWVRKGSLESYVVPPEFNELIVTGTGENLKGTFASGTAPFTQRVINPLSAQFPGAPAPDPEHPDFLGRIVTMYIGDPALSSAEAVKFYARRTYDLGAHAQKRLSFEAPLLLVTDVTDSYQRQPRPLRYGDAVKFEGQNFIVANCNPDYSGGGSGRKMMASYELFSPAQLDSPMWTPQGMD